MSSDAESPGMSRAERRVQSALDELHHCRAEFRRALQLGSVPQGVHLQFQQAMFDVFDELRPFRDEVEDEWMDAAPYENGLDALPSLGSRTRTQTSISISGGVPQTDSSTEPVLMQPALLLDISHNLDDISEKLGFAAEASANDPRVEIDDELMERVEQWRAQNQ